MLAFWLLQRSVLGFVPDANVYIGIEPQRLMQFDWQNQAFLREGQRWSTFNNDHPSWQARFDQHTGLPFRAWGGGIRMDTSSPENLERSIRSLVARYDVFGVKNSALEFTKINHAEERDLWYVHAEQMVGLSRPVHNDMTDEVLSAVPMWRSGLEFRISQGHLVLFGAQVYPGAQAQSWTPYLTASQAATIAIQKGPASQGFHTEKSARLLILPRQNAGKLEHRLCWETTSRTQYPTGKWISFVDAQTGELLNVYNEVRFLDGTLYGEHDTRTVNGDMSVSPLSQLNIDASQNRTGQDGTYSSDDSDIEVTLLGRRVRVQNDQDSDATLTLTGGEQTWTVEDASQAEIDQFVYINTMYEWAEEWAPQVVNGWPRATVSVNIDDVCNAYFDGELNFFRAGQGCNNTGRIADVSYHEWGHGFHYYNLLSGDYDGSMSEGIADSIAFLQTDDPIIAPYFGTNGGGIREVETNYSYPEDIVDEVHQDGLIFAGAVWDLWHMMRDEMGDELAFDTLMPIFVNGLRGGPTIPTVFDEFILADDDNGDLSDGTPNQCMIIEAFALHGLGPNGGAGLFSLKHTPLATQASTISGYELVAQLELFAENCAQDSVSNVTAHYSWDDGATWEQVDLEQSDDEIIGALPTAPAGTVVQYYIELRDSNGATSRLPQGGTINPYTFYVGDLEEIFCTDFEADDAQFTHSLIAGEEQEGADDWMWGAPLGFGGDPNEASSGDYVWGNDLGGEINGSQYNGEYQNDKHNRLLSPTFSVEGYDSLALVYDRWLHVEDGFYDQATILANGEAIWTNHSSNRDIGDEHHQDYQWQPHAIVMDEFTESSVQFSWDIQSDQGLTMGGWTIDNVCVYGVPEPQSDDLDGGDADDSLKAGCVSAQSSAPIWGLLSMFLLIGRRRR